MVLLHWWHSGLLVRLTHAHHFWHPGPLARLIHSQHWWHPAPLARLATFTFHDINDILNLCEDIITHDIAEILDFYCDLPSSSTALMRSWTSASVGFWPSDLITLNSFLVVMVPSFLLSNTSNASWRSTNNRGDVLAYHIPHEGLQIRGMDKHIKCLMKVYTQEWCMNTSNVPKVYKHIQCLLKVYK